MGKRPYLGLNLVITITTSPNRNSISENTTDIVRKFNINALATHDKHMNTFPNEFLSDTQCLALSDSHKAVKISSKVHI